MAQSRCSNLGYSWSQVATPLNSHRLRHRIQAPRKAAHLIIVALKFGKPTNQSTARTLQLFYCMFPQYLLESKPHQFLFFLRISTKMSKSFLLLCSPLRFRFDLLCGYSLLRLVYWANSLSGACIFAYDFICLELGTCSKLRFIRTSIDYLLYKSERDPHHRWMHGRGFDL